MEALSLTKSDWEERMLGWEQPAYRASQILEWIYQRRVREWQDMSNLPANLRNKLEAEFPSARLVKIRETGARDTTRKFLFRLSDGQLIESVLIPASPALARRRAAPRPQSSATTCSTSAAPVPLP
ncbi:MAG: hypothetical protein EBY32_19980, partial [Proteobacteria bacterium]|nr:hypothetical protein [Pseudomonadota bacterium]